MKTNKELVQECFCKGDTYCFENDWPDIACAARRFVKMENKQIKAKA